MTAKYTFDDLVSQMKVREDSAGLKYYNVMTIAENLETNHKGNQVSISSDDWLEILRYIRTASLYAGDYRS